MAEKLDNEDILIQQVEEDGGLSGGKERIRIGLSFQVADVKKPLVSVKRIAGKGNIVCFWTRGKGQFH